MNTIQTEIENQTINKIKPNQGLDKGKVDWVECEFNDVLEIISGKNQKQVVDSDGKYPIYGSGGIIGKANDFLCESGTTIIGRKGTINWDYLIKCVNRKNNGGHDPRYFFV